MSQLKPDRRILPISGSSRWLFSNEGEPWGSVQIVRELGTTDATYRIWTSNVRMKDISGYPSSTSPITGSDMRVAIYPYYSLEVGMSGTAFTGSATDAPQPSTLHFRDFGTRTVMLELSSSAGGPLTVLPNTKS